MDMTSLLMDNESKRYVNEYKNPLDPKRYPKAATSAVINPSEHFNFFTSLRELEDTDLPSAHFRAGFSRTGPWWPWMKMGGKHAQGSLFGRMHSHKRNRGFDDIPPKVLAYAEANCPDYLEPCEDWDDGFPIGTWEAYARSVPPEIP